MGLLAAAWSGCPRAGQGVGHACCMPCCAGWMLGARPGRDANPRCLSRLCSRLPGWRRALTPFPGASSLCLPCQRQPVPVLAPVQSQVSPTTLCSLSPARCLPQQYDYCPCILPDLCLGFWLLGGFPQTLGSGPVCVAAGAQNPSLFASRSGGRMWNLRVWGGGREGEFGIMCKTIKLLLTGNLKQWRVLLFLQIHELKTAANDGKC